MIATSCTVPPGSVPPEVSPRMKPNPAAGLRSDGANALPDPRCPRHRARHSRGVPRLVPDGGDVSPIQTEDGLSLEADWINASGKPVGVIVFCHPDPRQGGTMRAPLVRSVAGYLGRAGFHVLRFNFRGVGRSEGSWGGGDAEIHDVAAAMAAAATTHPDLPLGIAGWSFGAITALRWQAASASTDRYVGIAPALRLGSGPRVVPAARAPTPPGPPLR